MIALTCALVFFCAFVVTILLGARQAHGSAKAERSVPPPATQAGAAMLYYRIAQEETRLLERLVIADQSVPVFTDPLDRDIARGLIGTFYYERPPAIGNTEPIQQVTRVQSGDLELLRSAAHAKRERNLTWPSTWYMDNS